MDTRSQIEALRQRIAVQCEMHLLSRYQQLDTREQHLVLVAAVLLPLMLIVFGLLLPLQDRQLALRAELAQVQAQAAEATALAQYLSQHAGERKRGGAASENLLSVVDRIARQTHIRSFMTRIKPNNSPDGHEQLMLRMKDAPFDAALRFIHALVSHHLGLEMLKLQKGNTSGHVHIRAIITRT